MIHDRKTEYSSSKINDDPIGMPSFGTNHGTTACIGMSQIGYRSVVIPVPLSRNLVSSFGHELLRPSHPPGSKIHTCLSRYFAGTNRALSIRRPGVHSARRGHTRRRSLAGAGGLTKVQNLNKMIHGRGAEFSNISYKKYRRQM